MAVNHYLPAARWVTQAIPGLLARRGLDLVVSRSILTETEQGAAWLFIVIDASLLQHPEAYAAYDVSDYLSSELNGHPVVVISDSDGLRYGVLLNSHLNRPEKIPATRWWR